MTKLPGSGVALGIAVGSTVAQLHAGARRDHRVADRDVSRRDAGEALNGGVVAERLLDDGRRQRGIGGEPAPFVGKRCKREHRVADEVGGRLGAGDDEREREADDLRRRHQPPADLGLQQVADEVVARFACGA